MLIGDTVTYDGWNCVVVGFTPTSVRPAQVELSDPRTGTTFWVDLKDVVEVDVPQRAALRVLHPREGTDEPDAD
jgi:hypothetical protein